MFKNKAQHMNTKEAIQYHINEANQIKAQIYDAEKEISKAEDRLKELNGIIAALKRVEEDEVDKEHSDSD